MKKIININLSGRVIPIEDSAYERLQAYIESLRRYFSKEESRDEIINDIESRIAELMSEKVRKGASAISDADVDEIAASMGRPEDFDADNLDTADTTSYTSQEQQYSYTEKKKRNRLYRDSSDKFIGGVCSGIAAYLNVDPAIVRILFAIITFGGFGLGFLVYILLWIILPTKDLEGFSGKRLYRNPEDRVIGGVAGGLAAYFNRSASTIRIIFAAPILLSILLSMLDWITWRNDFDFFPNIVFGSLSGTFMLAYIILWMVLPEANSPYEKMEMRGEKVDVNSIRQNVKDGMDNMKDKVKNWSDEVKESAQNIGNKAKEFANTRGKAFATEVSETARRGGGGIGHAIGVLFKVFFLFIAGTIAFGLFVALIALIFGGVAWWPINDFLWTSNRQEGYAWGTLIFFLIVPLIGFIIWVIRRILRVRSKNSYLGWIFGVLWTIGWVSAALFAVSIAKDHREEYNFDTSVPITQPLNGRMFVTVSQPELEYSGSFGWMDNDWEGWDLSSDSMRMSTVSFDFEKSLDGQYHVILRKSSKGRTEEEAAARATKIQYSLYSRDSILDLGNGYSIDKESKFRWQHVQVIIQIPVGKKIRLDKSVNDKLNPVDFNSRDGRDDYWHRLLPDTDYTMGEDNLLRDGAGVPVRDYDYRYKNRSHNFPDTTESLEYRERRAKEELRNIEEERKYKERQKMRDSVKEESMDDEDNDGSGLGSSSPIFSLVSWAL
jgi:phage shock protein PspC (stress-responsive transcriptional regulator)